MQNKVQGQDDQAWIGGRLSDIQGGTFYNLIVIHFDDVPCAGRVHLVGFASFYLSPDGAVELHELDAFNYVTKSDFLRKNFCVIRWHDFSPVAIDIVLIAILERFGSCKIGFECHHDT